MPMVANISVTPDPAQIRRRAAVHRWRRVQAFGGFVLACTFFLPAVQSCSTPLSPAGAMLELVQNPPTDLDGWVVLPIALAVYLAAYLFGLLVAIALATQRPESINSPNRVSWVAFSLAPAASLAILLGVIRFIFDSSWAGLSALLEPAVLLAVWTLPYGWRCRRRGAGGSVCMRWYTALCCVLWFGWWTLQGALYGLHVSLAAAMLITAGAFEEARIRAWSSRTRVLGRLLTGNLELHDTDPSCCARCGYALHGLTTPRCPECGTPFDPHRLHNADMAVD